MQDLFEAFQKAFSGNDVEFEYVLELNLDGSGSVIGKFIREAGEQTILEFRTPEEGVQKITLYSTDWYALAKLTTPILWGQD
jgi:hypothetical protein